MHYKVLQENFLLNFILRYPETKMIREKGTIGLLTQTAKKCLTMATSGEFFFLTSQYLP